MNSVIKRTSTNTTLKHGSSFKLDLEIPRLGTTNLKERPSLKARETTKQRVCVHIEKIYSHFKCEDVKVEMRLYLFLAPNTHVM